jgi:ArsR family transcriptional regulator, arsenate/arsenite/antimonite-responsive transcriptional repressor
MNDFIAITKALADSNRVRALCALRNGELCVCQIIRLLSLAPSTVSKHMSILAKAGLVDSRKTERWVYYRLKDPKTRSTAIQQALTWIFGSLAQEKKIEEDAKTLLHIHRLSPETLCKNRASNIALKKTRRS